TEPVVFSEPGVTTVKLFVIDANGVIDPTPPSLTVTVEAAPVDNTTPPAATGPSGMIVMPEGDVTIAVGESVDFNAMGSSPDGLELTYLWNFGGGAPDFVGQMPGMVPFNEAGVFPVTLLVIDSAGNPDPNPPSITVTVVDPLAPIAQIISPAGDITIAEGDTVDFMGMGVSPSGAEPLSYHWDFDRFSAPTDVPNPGPVVFDKAGIYEAEFWVKDANGVKSAPVDIMITVEPASASTTPPPTTGGQTSPPTANRGPGVPDADIILPATRSVTIAVGDAVEFAADVENVDPATAIMVWDFDGAVPNVVGQNPGFVTFDMQGVYTVTFTVTSADGVVDPNPPKVEVIVEPAVP
ncbi:MAG: PKD domain-containing protein, partial [Gammaproteobacteria bacterium]|nr:PKD domain-containing protein [Gammaproteobacteria bacterium]